MRIDTNLTSAWPQSEILPKEQESNNLEEVFGAKLKLCTLHMRNLSFNRLQHLWYNLVPGEKGIQEW